MGVIIPIMVNRPKIKGTMAESAVVSFLRSHGWPHAERLALQGAQDRGDVTGTPGLVWEVKNVTVPAWRTWLAEAETERINANGMFGIVVAKPKGVGVSRVGQWWAGMLWGQFESLLDQVAEHSGAPQWWLHEVPGARVNQMLPAAVRNLDAMAEAAQADFGVVRVRPVGVEIRHWWYTVTTLDQMVRILAGAGFGGS